MAAVGLVSPPRAIVVRDAWICAEHWHRQFARTDSESATWRAVRLFDLRGLRESRTVADKHTRVRIALPLTKLARFRELLAEPMEQPTTDTVI